MRVLVIASGHTVESDLAKIDRADFDCIIGVNRAAILYGPVDYHITLHPRVYAPQKVARMISHEKPVLGVDEVFDCQWRLGGSSGSSGLYAVKYALERLGADQVVLAGVPMEGKHIYTSMDWPQALLFRREWEHVAPVLRGKVTSLSGWTARLLNGDSSPEAPVHPASN